MDTTASTADLRFEDRLTRSAGRGSRNRMANARVTHAEQKELEAAAKAQGKALSEWAREVLLREARRGRDDALFTETIATRMLLVNLIRPLAMGQKLTQDHFAEVMQTVRTGKHKAAQEVMQQYTGTEPREG